MTWAYAYIFVQTREQYFKIVSIVYNPYTVYLIYVYAPIRRVSSIFILRCSIV